MTSGGILAMSEMWRLLHLPSLTQTQYKLTAWKKNTNLTGYSSYVFSIERTGHILKCMQLYFTGHHQYVKAISLFLEEMVQMKKDEPENWTQLAKTHVFRHSYSHGSGIATVFVVEQVLMCSLPWMELGWGTVTRMTSVSTTCVEYNQPSETHLSQILLFWPAYP